MISYNAIGYIVFLAVIFFVTFQIGWKFYNSGEVYIRMLMPEDPHLVQSINKLLLVGYYLLNLGYASISISSWPLITSELELLSYLSDQVGFIILMLALIHYFNLVWLLLYSRYVQRKHKSNNTINA